MDLEEYLQEKARINWEYAKQLNDIHCRLYLQFFVIYLTIGISLVIAVLVEELNAVFYIPPIFFFLLAIYYIFRLRSLPDELESARQRIVDDLEKLIK
jgi:hypothetical protein